MGWKDVLGLNFATEEPEEKIALDYSDKKGIAKLLRPVSMALGFTGYYNGRGKGNFEPAPYEFDKIIKAADTDSFVRQALQKYQELIWKEGWDIIGENDTSVDYLRERIAFMEFSMQQPFEDFLHDVSDQLVRFHNCFIAKSRGDLSQFFPGRLNPPEGKDPLVGYYIIPAETIEIVRDKHNKPIYYRQKVENLVFGYQNTRKRPPTWKAEDVIHLHVDKKPGRAFGTPFLVAVLDDVLALRQMEQDIQNLVHQEIFPLYVYQVGTETSPAEPDELTQAASEIASIRADGGVVVPERHNLSVLGADDDSLDASNYLQHFITRVCVGLGLSPHHLGVMMNGGNRSVTDRLDIALYDKIKNYQRYLADMIRFTIFTELLLEGGFDPFIHPDNEGESDRCDFRFREIDVDTQVKKESHALQKFAMGAIDQRELRMELGLDPDGVIEELLQAAIQARLTPIQTKTPDGTTKTEVPQKPDAATPSNGGRSNPKNNTKGIGNKVRPSNQHGRRNSPNVRHADEALLTETVSLID